MINQNEQLQIGLNDLPSEYRDVARLIGLDNALKLVREFSGVQLYVPRYDTVIRGPRDRAIKAEFDGSNYKRLAVKYGLSESHTRQVIKAK
jgi:Mor family transcriptional regulator